jgi:hypothetical protein
VIGEAADSKRGPVAHRRVAVAHERQQHFLRALVADQVLERGRHRPAHVRRIVHRETRQRVDRARVLLLRERVHDRLEHGRFVIAEHALEHAHSLLGIRAELADDVRAGDAVGGIAAAAELHTALEHFASAECVQLADRGPARVVVLLPNDDCE